jgi:uncharacterized protein YodC (DUF2158 family)
MAYSVGDRVKLRSGGPLMTVSQVLDRDNVECAWFDRDDRLQKERFATVLLMNISHPS